MPPYMAVIVNVGSLTARFSWQDDCHIPERCRPTFVHHDKESAEKELARLARNYPGEFVLFEAAARGTAVQTCAGMVGRVDPLSVEPKETT